MNFRYLCLCLVFLANHAHAALWREVGTVEETGTQVSVDDSTLAVDRGSIVTGWVKFDFAKPQERDGQKLSGYISHRMVDCAANRYWVMEGWGYPSSNAEPVRLYSTTQEWQMPPPDSEAEIASAALCVESQTIFEQLGITARLQIVWGMLQTFINRSLMIH